MKPICRNWVPRNEYTKPLEGEPYYRSSGIIYAEDRYGERFAVGRIDFERFDEQNFQYVFTPKWGVIDALPPMIFQGIPGLDMDLRLERYYRVNMTPVFITERTPGQNREDLWELLESVEMDYYDRFEWMLRTKMRCGTDNLIVERASEFNRLFRYYVALRNWRCRSETGEEISSADGAEDDRPGLQPGDTLTVDCLEDLAGSNRELRQVMIRILGSGVQIRLEEEGRTLSEEECSAMLKLLLLQRSLDERCRAQAQQAGIETAKAAGKYKGRKRTPVDRHVLEVVAQEFAQQRITEDEAMKRLGIGSRSTFYRRLRELRQETSANKCMAGLFVKEEV